MHYLRDWDILTMAVACLLMGWMVITILFG